MSDLVKNIKSFHSHLRNLIASRLNEILDLRDRRSTKDDGSYVTEGDLLINELIIGMSISEFQNAIIISEESRFDAETNLNSHIIVLDPIDGTENFTSGMAEWGISISHYNNGIHIGSMLYCPEMDIWIESGDKQINRSTSRIRGLSSSLSKLDLDNITQGYEYRILGCCVYNMINVIRGSYLSFENPKGAKSWDILAGLNIGLEYNLKVIVDKKPYNGEYLHPGKRYKFKLENR